MSENYVVRRYFIGGFEVEIQFRVGKESVFVSPIKVGMF